jgi:hypothetical protein
MLKYFASLPILWICFGFCATAATPILRFPDGISWKRAFDAGLRPKHVPGLERKMTECKNQPLRFELEGSSEPFLLDPGRLSIELRPDDSVRLYMHTGHIPISMEEGEKRLMTFRRVFGKHLIGQGSMPPIMDKKRGSVMTSSEQAATARIGEHGFTYGFTGTSNKDYPLIPRFQLAWVGTGRENTSNIRRKIVEPPAGYEWYSMDPKVHTPDPGSEAEKVDPLPEATGRPERRPRGESAESPQPSYAPVEAARPRRWGAWILLALSGLGIVVWRWTRKSA